MEKSETQIEILPHGRMIKAFPGVSLMESLMQQSIFLRSDCGGKGKCGKCQVHKITHDGHQETILSCMHMVEEDISIQIPESSMASSHIMSKASISFPPQFREGFKTSEGEDVYGIAVDLGTTTIAVYLCNIVKGAVVSSLAVKNPQAIYGDDVMSRIGVINQSKTLLGQLQNLVVRSIEWGIKKLLAAEEDDKITLSEMVVVGNPTMIHILAGIDPKPIGMFPYQPAFYEARKMNAGTLGFDMEGLSIQTLPQVSGFIGGDILAAAMATELSSQPDGTLLIDLGTNGELLLKNKDQLFATSCATGPAFEGASLSCGMQAIPGAINSVEIDDDQRIAGYSTVDSGQLSGTGPSGICGAGIINAVAQFCKKGIVDSGGAFKSAGKDFVLVAPDTSSGQPSVFISQKDIRSVQLGKSALITGIEFLLRAAGREQPVKIMIAGAFGSYLNKSDMLQLGMIPDIAPDKIETAGNAAGSGAVMALCDHRYIEIAVQMAGSITMVDLACNVDFQKAFIKNLNFPAC